MRDLAKLPHAKLRSLAYAKLGVDPNLIITSARFTPFFKGLPGGIDFCLDCLRSSDSDVARRFLFHYDDIRFPRYMRELLPLEAFALAAGLTADQMIATVTGACLTRHVQHASILAAVNHPRVVTKSIEVALTDDGVVDRMAQLKHVGFLPSPKGSQVSVNVNANAAAQSDSRTANSVVVAAPPAEDTIRRLNDRFNESRRELAASESRQLPAAPIDAEYVEADDV